MREVVLILPGYLPASPNRLRGAHWTLKQTERTKAQRVVDEALNTLTVDDLLDLPRTRAVLHVWMRGPGVTDDEDNRIARCKPLIDALVKAGFVDDDSPDHLTLGRFLRDSGPTDTIVSIEYPT